MSDYKDFGGEVAPGDWKTAGYIRAEKTRKQEAERRAKEKAQVEADLRKAADR